MNRRIANGSAAALLVVVTGFAACFRAPGATTAPPHLQPLAAALPAELPVTWARTAAPAGPLPAEYGGMLWLDGTLQPLPERLAPEVVAGLRAFVQAGGRLALFGPACRFVADLGLAAAPEATTFRWGFDARAVRGDARLGFQVVSGQHPDLFATMTPSPVADDVYFLAGGAPCEVPLCTWPAVPSAPALVLGRLALQRDGGNEPLGAPVLVHWPLGGGAVLACGVVPALDHADAAVRDAAQAFVRRCSAWAAGRGRLLAGGVAPPAPPAALPEPPRALPLLAHWGWRLPLAVDGLETAPDELVAEAMLPSWGAGASLVDVELSGAGGVPLDWRSGDPLRPAPSFESRPVARHWHRAAFAALAAEAHGRGLLAFAALEPLPVGERAVERLATLRFLARELACLRSRGAGAFDGFGLHDWSPDRSGFTVAMLQDFQPAGVAFCLGERAPGAAGVLRAVDAADGAVAGLPFQGISARWRDGFPAAGFPLGVLDAGNRGAAIGHAGNADWLVTQANDFVRPRAGRGAAMIWRRHDPAELPRDAVPYVHGLGLEPLRAAVAMPLSATGSDGLRAAAAATVPGVPAAYGVHVPAPAAVHVLQNNWFRLLGSGGALEFDARGTADFAAGALRLSPALLRTRLFGSRPDGSAVRTSRRDFLADGLRGEGGYGAVARVGGVDVQPPALLQRGVAPAWPGAVHCDWNADIGYHELDLLLRTVRGRGVLVVSLDGVVLRAVPFDGGPAAAVTVPVHVARAGLRRLEFAVLDGGAVAFDRLLLRRVGDVGVEAAVELPAGSLATLREASQSSYHHEALQLTTAADFPGFVVTTRCERAARNLQVERVLAWPEHRELVAAQDGDGVAPRFLLRAADARLPDLVVVLLQHARYETLRWRDGELCWRAAPEAGMQSRLGVLFCRRGDGARWLALAPAMLAALAEPMVLPRGEDGEAALVCADELPWSRVVRLPGDGRTPFLVCEQGFWSQRGSQATADGVLLRVQQAPGDVVRIRGGAAVLAGMRPGPGSANLLQWRDDGGGAATVRVVQTSALVTPSVVLPGDVGELWLDGAPWAHHDGNTVFLPSRVGTVRLATKPRSGAVTPHVRASAAPFSVCRYDAASRQLVLATAGDVARPAELPWTAVLGGPVPTGIDNGEIVADESLRLGDADSLAAARQGGVLIRFRSGVCRVRYGD